MGERIEIRALLGAMALFLSLLLGPAAAQDGPSSPSTPPLAAGIKSWGYQLQGIDPSTLAKVPYDAIVIDYSRDGRAKNELSPDDVQRMKVKPDGSRRVVLAYMSIGEAESYRYYWNAWWGDLWFIPNFITKPSWRGKLNSEWGGNYAVRYWDSTWQAVILGNGGYLDRIVKAGFDGVWLDKVDSSLEDIAEGRPTAKADMIAFIKAIAEKARAAKSGFLVFPQNGEALLADASYRAVIDGFGKEDLLYGEDGAGKPNTPATIEEKARLLKLLVAGGKPVLAVEYLNDKALITSARQQIAGYGFIPHFADRALETMRIDDPAEGTSVAALTSTSQAKGRAPGSANEQWTIMGFLAAFGIIVLIGMMTGSKRR